MDRKSLIGLILIFALFYFWAQMQAPSEVEIAEQKRIRDSIALIEAEMVSEESDTGTASALTPDSRESDVTIEDSTLDSVPVEGIAEEPLPEVPEKTYTLENEKMEITFSSRGGKITAVNLKDYEAISAGEKDEDVKSPLILMADERNKWEYYIPQGQGRAPLLSSRLMFTADVKNESIIFTATLPNGGSFTQEYILDDDYLLNYNIQFDQISGLSRGNTINFIWENYLPMLEKNTMYEKQYATLYYKEKEKDPTYLSTSKASQKKFTTPVKWVSFSNQFFNSTLISDLNFESSKFALSPTEEEDSSLVYTSAEIGFDIKNPASEQFNMELYIGPNDFDRLTALGNDISDIVPFGWSIFGTINRWIIRPLFNFLSGFVGSKGIVIIILTILVKLGLFPLTYKMLKSQTMMAGLKPEIEKIKKKHKGDQQGAQVETMNLYREYGVSPLGGCLPMVVQMPIWFALYRFFPASIEFRQAGFLWATDLSSYDVFYHLPFNIPFYGSHISLFTLLWALSLLGYTHYNMKINPQMSGEAMGGNMAMMKYMQYFMPLMFLFFLNSYAAGLTCYLLFSNLTNIAQTVFTKEVILDDEKIQKKLAVNREKKKNTPKSKWQQRLEEAMNEQKKKTGK